MRFLTTAFCAAAFAVVAPAQACSPLPGYRVPTNLELAERADTIVVGTVERAITSGEGDPPGYAITIVRPTLLLKGSKLPEQVELEGWMADSRMSSTRSDPRELFQPNPDSFHGGCVRYIFEPGMKLVLFYERKAGQLRFARYPFARVSEDVPSDNAPWVRAVRLYVEIAALPKSQRREALITRRDALLAAKDDPDAALLAADIERQLRGDRL